MKRFAQACAFLVFCGLFAACSSFSIFEDVGTNPHPPQVQLLGVAYQPVIPAEEPAPEPTPAPAASLRVAVAPPPEFLSPDAYIVRPGDSTANTFLIRVRFADVGGDITVFKIRDRNGPFNVSLSPTPPVVDLDGDGVPDTLATPNFFAGVAGIVDLQNVAFTTGIQGAHQLELWAEDSHESRSEKILFTLTVML